MNEIRTSTLAIRVRSSLAALVAAASLSAGLALAHDEPNGRPHNKGIPANPTAVMRAFMNDSQAAQLVFPDSNLAPFDIHGAAQGIITFALAHKATGVGADHSRKVLLWTMAKMYDPRSRWFYYQKGRFMRTRIRLLRWCQAWMAWAAGCHLEHCGELPC